MPAAAVGMVFIGAGIGVGAWLSYKQAENAKDAAKDAATKRDDAFQDMLNLANKQYDRWEQDFGKIQTEVADYYKNLSDDILKQQYEDANTEATGSLVQQYFAAQSTLNANMNKTGMAGSGAAQSSNLQLQQSMLAQKAQNRWQTQQLKANANNVLMGQKSNWVQQGENLRNQAMSNQYNANAMIGQDAANQYMMHKQAEYQAQTNMINTISMGAMNMGGMLMGMESGMAKAGMEFDWSQFKYVNTQNQNPNNTTTTQQSVVQTPQAQAPLQTQYYAYQLGSGNTEMTTNLGLDSSKSSTNATVRRYQ